MMRFRNEAAFSRALVQAMRIKGWFVQRIESGETGAGIPDIYCISSSGIALWLELKRIHHRCSRYEIIPWRPTQQPYLMQLTRYKQKALTLVCFDDGIWSIPHYHHYAENRVDMADERIHYFNSIKELLG